MTSGSVETTGPRKHRRFLGGVFWVIAVGSAVQLWLALFMVPKFEIIFRDMLADQHLPLITTGVIGARWTLVGIAFLLLLSAWLIAKFVGSPRGGATGMGIVLVLVIAQIPLTAFALMLPLAHLVSSIQADG